MKLTKSAIIALSLSTLTITTSAIALPILISQHQNQVPITAVDPDQNLLNPSGYQDLNTGMKVDRYGNLVQALAISPLMNFNNLTNQTLNRKLQGLGLNNYQLKIISATTNQDVIKLSFNHINDEDQNQNEITTIIISDFNWSLKPFNPTVINTKPLLGWQWDVKAWIDQKLPLTFDGNFNPNQQQQLSNLNDQKIKSLIERWDFQTDLPLFSANQSGWINWRSLDQNQKDRFQFQFVPFAQSVQLKITIKDPNRIANWIYDPNQDQWVAKANDKPWQLVNNEAQWLGTLTMVDEISAKQHLQSGSNSPWLYPHLNQALINLMTKRIFINLPKVPLASTASELLYWQEHDPEGFFKQPVFQNLLTFKDDLIKAYFPDLKYRFGYDLVAKSNGAIQPESNQFLKISDQDFANDLGSDQIIINPYLEVNNKKYRLYDEDSWGTSNLFNIPPLF